MIRSMPDSVVFDEAASEWVLAFEGDDWSDMRTCGDSNYEEAGYAKLVFDYRKVEDSGQGNWPPVPVRHGNTDALTVEAEMHR